MTADEFIANLAKWARQQAEIQKREGEAKLKTGNAEALFRSGMTQAYLNMAGMLDGWKPEKHDEIPQEKGSIHEPR